MRIIQIILLSVAVALSQTEQTRTYKWMYQGNYVLGDVLSDLCSRVGCALGLSGDVVDLPVTLSIKTNSHQALLSALRLSVAASGTTCT